MNIYKLLKGKKVRIVKEKATGTVWFNATDITAALRGTDTDTARNYFNNLKHKKDFITKQIKMIAKDGKMRFTNVLNERDIKRLIIFMPKMQNAWAFLVCSQKIENAVMAVNGLGGAKTAVIKITTIREFFVHADTEANRGLSLLAF